MKISITDQFLWDVYSVLEGVGDVAHFFLRRRRIMRDVLYCEGDPSQRRYLKELSQEQFSKLIHHLKRNNFIKVQKLKGKQAIILTKKGLDKAIKARFKIEGSQKKKIRHDGKWLMIIFDVPENYKKKRELLRSILQNLGYKMFQKSVWITPYDVSEKTEKLLQFYSLDEYARIFLIEEIE